MAAADSSVVSPGDRGEPTIVEPGELMMSRRLI